ncbi:MAG: 1,2-phenylacetyl-CoA epoxidase subunit PaaD [Acidimicrobiales bacterium]
MVNADLARAVEVVGNVVDPELPLVTLADLGVVRDVAVDGGRVTVTLTPTYTGCPAMREMAEDVRRSLCSAGFDEVEVRSALSPAWSSDWISPEGRRKLEEAGVAPPLPAPSRARERVPLALRRRQRPVCCPRCGSARTRLQSTFSSTACKALYRCAACAEPFEYFKEL